MMAALIARYLPLAGDEPAALERYIRPVPAQLERHRGRGIAAGGAPRCHPGRPKVDPGSRTTGDSLIARLVVPALAAGRAFAREPACARPGRQFT
jgi:hypothetical protein